MPDQLQLRGGTTVQHSTFTGASKEVTVDTTKKTVVVHDGSTAGGNPVMREDASNSALALGSAGTPSLKFTGDTNTGIYSPGADQVAISTGGSGRLFITSTGAVGIGGSPSSGFPFEIKAGAIDSTARFDSTNAVGPHIRFSNSGTDTHFLGSTPGFTSGGTSNDFGIRTAGYFEILTGGNNPRLRVTSAGLVGVGTSSPGSLLTSYPGNVSTLGAKASTGLLIDNNGSAGNISQIGLGYTFSGTYHPVAIAAITDSGSGSTRADLHFATRSLTTDSAPDTRMIIKSDGKVGIGTSSPSSLLHLSVATAASDGTKGVRITNPAGTAAMFECGSSNDSYIGTTSGSDFSIRTNNTSRIYVTNGGNVGIGVTPSYKLHVDNGTTTDAAYLGNGYGGLVFGCNSSGERIINTNASGPIVFQRGGTETARIDSSSRLLVGTSNQPNTGGTLCVNNGIGIVNNTTGRFASVEHGSGANGAFTTITISATVISSTSSVIFETLMTGYSGVYLDSVIGKYSNQASVTMRNNASAGTSAALAVDGTGLIYTLTITTSVTHPVVKVKVTGGGLTSDITRPTITFA